MAVALARNSEIVDSLRRALSKGHYGLSDVPLLVKRILRDDLWQQRVVQETGEIIAFERFEQFVTAYAPEGLGSDLRTLKRLCGDDREALDLIDQVTANGWGGDHKSEQYRNNVDNVHIDIEERPSGNSADRALRKLRQDAPHLHERVLAGELSPHAAMIEAGYRKKTITVPLDPDAAVRRLATHFSNDDLMHIASAIEAIVTERES